MGFSEAAHQRFGQDGGSSDNSAVFYQLRIQADDGSPNAMKVFGGKQMYGFYEIGYFMMPLLQAPLVKFHPTNRRMELVLCGKTFGKDFPCPACQAFESFKQMYGDTKEAKDKYPIKAKQEVLSIPFFVPRRQGGKHVYKGRSIIRPIYWFELKVTDYIDDCKQQYQRLVSADMQSQIHCNPYMIFRRDTARGEKTEYYFEPQPFNPAEMRIIDDHPLLRFFQDRGPNGYLNVMGRQEWDLLENLALLRFQPYIDPQTGQPFDYNGYYQHATQAYDFVKNQWPRPSVKIEVPAHGEPLQTGTSQYQQQPVYQNAAYQQPMGAYNGSYQNPDGSPGAIPPAQYQGGNSPAYAPPGSHLLPGGVVQSNPTVPYSQNPPPAQQQYYGPGYPPVQNPGPAPAPPVQNYGQPVNPYQQPYQQQYDVQRMLNDSDIPF